MSETNNGEVTLSYEEIPLGVFVQPFPTITKRQLKKQLIAMGKLPSAIDTFISTIVDDFEREEALADWGANEFQREHFRVAQFAAILGITDSAEIDAAWLAAAQIV